MIKSLKHLLYLLRLDRDELDDVLAQVDMYYYEKIEQKTHADGSPKIKNGIPDLRVIHPSKAKLKNIQKRINSQILTRIPLPSYAFGAIKGKDNIRNADKHVGKKYMFTTDLKSFFPSITNQQVYSMFISYSFSPDIAAILTKLTTYRGCIPQGAPTSSYVANHVFVHTGKKLETLAKANYLTFTTFVDDITFSSSQCFKFLVPDIIHALESDGYTISHKKTYYKAGVKIVTGVIVKQNGLGISKTLKAKLDAEVDKQSKRYRGLSNYKTRILSFNSN